MQATSRPIVLVTGASGFIGQATARRLERDYQVIGLDSKAPKLVPPLKEFVPIDLTSHASVEGALEHVQEHYGERIASVIHLAAYYDFSGEPSPLYEQVTIRGTERLLSSLRRFRVEQLVFSSTLLVHAPTEPGQPITEDSPLDPKWDYPASKVRTEEILREKAVDIPCVILRIAGVYNDACHSIQIANQIQRIFERKLVSHVFPGDTSHGQTSVHVDDLVTAFERALERRHELGKLETFLIGEPEVMSYEELQREIGRLVHGEEWETRHIPKAVAKAGAWIQDQVPGEDPFIKPWMIDMADEHFEINISRARVKLGWSPRRTLRSTLPRMIERLKTDPQAFYRENKLSPPAWLEPQKPQRQPVPA